MRQRGRLRKDRRKQRERKTRERKGMINEEEMKRE